MRFISRYCIREGMTLDKPIYNSNGSLLLKKGTKINRNYKNKINNIGLSGIYINDDLSRDIEMEDTVNVEIRNEAISGVKRIFNHISIGEDIDGSLKNAIGIMDNIIKDILNNKVLLVNMIDIKLFDDYTFAHSVNVAVLSILVGVSLKLDEKELYELGMAALLHDVGKVFTPSRILNKKGKLTKEEMDVIKTHPKAGYDLLRHNKLIPKKTLEAIIDHHERWDGEGYPNNKKGKDISFYGRIVSICDVYDALTSDRAYKDATLPSDAMEYIIGSSGTQFDFKLVNVFYDIVATYPLGTIVKLSDGRKAIVIKNHQRFSSRPTLRTLDTKETLSLISDMRLLNVTIVEVVKDM